MCTEAVLPGLASWSPANGTKLAHPGRGSEALTSDIQLKGVRMDTWIDGPQETGLCLFGKFMLS